MSQAGHFGRGSLLMPLHFPGILFLPTRRSSRMLLSHTLLLLLHIGESMQQRVMIIVGRQTMQPVLAGGILLYSDISCERPVFVTSWWKSGIEIQVWK
ncbi:Titin [Gossypium arboreum]|uniref:Titin n=1 Tax=Gossypium arboreum TaxID=29729 RepID=A0A0B0MBQ6_GOSAR|nr:Titin [Gossypium arboreum]